MNKLKTKQNSLQKLRVLLIGAFVLAGSIMLTSCKKQETISFFAMDTYMSITAYGRNPEKALKEVKEKILELDKLWNATNPESEIYKANNTGTAEISKETADLIEYALKMGKETDGALDITIYPLLKAWGFTEDHQQVPSEGDIKKALENIDYRKITVNRTEDGKAVLSVPSPVEIELGAVGKGYVGDLAAEILKENGIDSALIDLGGNIQVVGGKPDDTKSGGADWTVGFKSPFDGEVFGWVKVKNKAIVTSGGYERYFEEDGKIYWHIMDPKTGYPADSGLLSVSVVAESGALCDALSTAIFVMGEEKAIQLWKERQDFEFVIVKDDGTVAYTEGLSDCIEFLLVPGSIKTNNPKRIHLND